MKYFVGARALSNGQRVAEEIDANDFADACSKALTIAAAECGPENFRVTQVNEKDDAASSIGVGRLFSSLTIVDEPVRAALVDGASRTGEVDLRVHHSTAFTSIEEARKSPAARLVSIAYRLIDAILNGTITDETRVLDFYRSDAGMAVGQDKPLIVLPGTPEISEPWSPSL